MPVARNGQVQLHYEVIGDPDGVPLLLVAGHGSQLLVWHEELCQGFADRGFVVVRFDNRDAGLSTRLPAGSSYSLSDMAGDAVAVLDDAGLGAAFVAGVSLGGIVAQTMAIDHPDRVLGLISISSMTGNLDHGAPPQELLDHLTAEPEDDPERLVEQQVAQRRLWASPDWFDEDAVREYFRACAARSAPSRDGAVRQLEAVLLSGPRDDGLRKLDVPTLVIHGELDPLVPPEGGRHTASLVPGARLLMVERMAHDLPVQVWPLLIEAVTELAASTHSG